MLTLKCIQKATDKSKLQEIRDKPMIGVRHPCYVQLIIKTGMQLQQSWIKHFRFFSINIQTKKTAQTGFQLHWQNSTGIKLKVQRNRKALSRGRIDHSVAGVILIYSFQFRSAFTLGHATESARVYPVIKSITITIKICRGEQSHSLWCAMASLKVSNVQINKSLHRVLKRPETEYGL